MTQKTAYFPFSGGLDITSPASMARPGSARAGSNYEADYSGYRRISGYERYDGRTSPTDAYAAAATEAQGAIDREAARLAILAVPGTGSVRGVWYYNDNLYGWRDALPLEKVTNGTFNTDASSWVPSGSSLSIVGAALRLTNSAAAAGIASQGISTVIGRTYRLTGTFVNGVNGDGRIRVGTVANGNTLGNLASSPVDHTFVATTTTTYITLRNNSVVAATYVDFDNISLKAVDPEAASMYRATPTGWTLVSALFPPGGSYSFVNYNFYGASSSLRMYGVNGAGKAFQFDGTTVTFITTGMATDIPFKIEAHKRHLFLAFPGGSVQNSSLGDPLAWAPITGALEIAMGDEITDLVSAAPANLVILAKNSVAVLYGNDSSDWQLEVITNEAGAIPNTAEKMGPVIYMDNRGVRALNTTPSFGNFTLGTMTQLISPLLRVKIQRGQLPVASCRVRTRDTYRVFFGDGTGISIFMGRKQPESMFIDLGVAITCVVSAEDDDTKERIFFGSDNGMVYEMDRGRSFDGGVVASYVRLPFNHMGGPRARKRWHKIILDYDAPGTLELAVSGEFDYADPNEPSLIEQTLSGFGGGAFWDTGVWDQFYWSSPVEGQGETYIDGIGENMSLLLGSSHNDREPHTLQGLTMFYTVKGMVR